MYFSLIVDGVTVFGFVCLVVNTSASDCLGRLVPEKDLLCVERDVKLYSLTHSG